MTPREDRDAKAAAKILARDGWGTDEIVCALAACPSERTVRRAKAEVAAEARARTDLDWAKAAGVVRNSRAGDRLQPPRPRS